MQRKNRRELFRVGSDNPVELFLGFFARLYTECELREVLWSIMVLHSEARAYKKSLGWKKIVRC